MNVFPFAKDLVLINVYLQATDMHLESSIIIIVIIIITIMIIVVRKSCNGHKEIYMYKFYAVQRWSSYAYSAVNLKVGGVYLMLCYLQFVHFVEVFCVYVCVWGCRGVCMGACVCVCVCVRDMKTLLCIYSKEKLSFVFMGIITFIMPVSLVQ